MFAFFEKTLQRIRPILRIGVKSSVLLLLIFFVVFVIEAKVLPWLSTQSWAIRLGVASQSGERVTVIERKESVTISQDENIERMATEYGNATVGVLEEEITPFSRPASLALQQSKFLSGIFVTNDGLLVTYRDGAPDNTKVRYTVYLNDTLAHSATIVGYDTLTNLLYLRLRDVTTSAIAFGNSNEAKAGRRLVILSRTADGLSVVSSNIGQLQRSFNLNPQTVHSSEKWEGVFGLGVTEHVAATLGSPALFMNGELAGVYGTTKVDGMTSSFLIPANAVRESLSRVLEGKAERPMIGIYYLTVTPAVQQVLGLPTDRGAMIYSPSERTGLSLLAGSPAARAGLQFGDLITKVNGTEINLDMPLSVVLGRLPVTGTVTLEILRNGARREILLTL